MQWQAPQNGEAAGDVSEVDLSGDAPDQTLNVTTVPVKVTISGGQLTLTVTGIDALSVLAP